MSIQAFKTQSPEHIAKEYGGDKTKIAQAMQQGSLDPTSAVLAGMFIDRIRAAQAKEQAPVSTVAQDVLTSPAPQVPAGLGATAPAQAMAPPGGMPPLQAGAPPMPMSAAQPVPPPPQAGLPPAPMGMADGGMYPSPAQAPYNISPQAPYPSPYMKNGVSDIPIPDAMFDEPQTGETLASGGLVAFADGGLNNFDLSSVMPALIQTESGWNPNAVSPAGAFGLAQLMPGTASDPGFGITPLRNNSSQENTRLGSQYLAAMMKKYGNLPDALAAYNWGPGHMDRWIASGRRGPMPKETQDYVQKVLSRVGGGDVTGTAAPTPVANVQPTVLPPLPARPESIGGVQATPAANLATLNAMAPQEHKYQDIANQYYEKQISPEETKKRRKEGLWDTLAQIGFGMAATRSPYFLQAVGDASLAALPTMRAHMQESKEIERDAYRQLASGEAKTNEEKRQLAAAALGASTTYEQLAQKEEEIQSNRDIQAMQDTTQRQGYATQRQTNIDVANINLQGDIVRAGATTSQLKNRTALKETVQKSLSQVPQIWDRMQQAIDRKNWKAAEQYYNNLVNTRRAYEQAADQLRNDYGVPVPDLVMGGKKVTADLMPAFVNYVESIGKMPSGKPLTGGFQAAIESRKGGVSPGVVMSNPERAREIIQQKGNVIHLGQIGG